VDLDILFLHPPALYDFRKRILFPGPVAHTVADSTHQFIVFPIGLLSMAEYLDRNGCRTAIDNLGERMVASEKFDAESHLRKSEARVYAIDLHWCTHSQGAIEVAKMCKRFHPNSFVLLGGLTATCFHEEIMLNFPFIDGVIRGEAEDPLLQLMRRLKTHGSLLEVPNLTHRDGSRIVANGLSQPCSTLDDADFTRLDLVSPREAPVFERASIPICRGCLYNCATCGGSAYSYRRLFGRDRPAFRSPVKITDDLQKLDEQGVQAVFLFQDPCMGGRKYWRELVRALKSDNSNIDTISLELFAPPPAEFLKSLSSIRERVTLTISPESGVDTVMNAHGRPYTDTDLRSTAALCKRLGLRLTVFFMVGLAGENHETFEQTSHLWEEFYAMSHARPEGPGAVRHVVGSMILLDPGSLAFDHPGKYGYKLFFKNLRDYIAGMTMPSWHQWISYETSNLSRADIARLTLYALAESARVREKYGVYAVQEEAAEHYFISRLGQIVLEEVDRVIELGDDQVMSDRLRNLSHLLTTYPQPAPNDPYGYAAVIRRAAIESVGLLDAAY
jgi:B12-binding domain/radical SAM domain protein